MNVFDGLTDEDVALWKRHWSGDAKARENLILKYMPEVDHGLRAFRNVRIEDRNDLRGAGYFGLIKAVDEWNPEKMRWTDFLRFKIRYAAVDAIRANSWVPKGVRQKARRIEDAEEELTAAGVDPTVPAVAAKLGMTEDECDRQIASFRATDWSVTSLEGRADMEGNWYETLEDPGAPDPEHCSLWAEAMDDLELVLQRLPAQDRLLIRWKYFHWPKMPQKEMARRLGVHESRVSQLLDSAIVKAQRLAEHPTCLFPEVFSDDERFTSRD